MAYKRVTYQVEVPVPNLGTRDYLFDGLSILMTQGQWSKTFVSSAIPPTVITAGVVADVALDDNGLAGLRVGIDAAGGLPSNPQDTVLYSLQFLGSGGIGPYTYAQNGGTLPTGLTLSAAGLLSGTPSAVATFNFVVKVTDAAGYTHNEAISLSVDPA